MLWSTWFTPLLLGLNLVGLPFFLMMLVTSLAALCSRRRSARPASPRTRFLVVIPAHDEEDGIAETVRSCRSVEYPGQLFQVLVVADNCTDRTAAIARREGATVLERRDPLKKSKGYAIEYVIDRLRESGTLESFDAFVIVDADSTVSRGLLRGFAAEVEAGRDWAQCRYAVANPDVSWRTRLMAYAFSLFNGVTLQGQSVLGLGAGLRGNGMCISMRGLQRVPWKSFGLVEDLEYSWSVRVAGGKVAFLPDEVVNGQMVGHGGKAAVSQRQRWEAGRQEVRRRFFLPLLRSRFLNPVRKITSLLELIMPPMVPLLAYCLGLLIANATVLLVASPGGAMAWALAGSSLLMVVAVTVHAVSPFLLFGLPWSYLLILPYLPFYALWKCMVLLQGRPKQWVRTPREQPANH